MTGAAATKLDPELTLRMEILYRYTGVTGWKEAGPLSCVPCQPLTFTKGKENFSC